MGDGRVIYAAQSFPQEPGGAARIRLHAIHIEGADMEVCGGGAGERMRRMPCATDGGLVVFVEAGQPTPDGAGHLACFLESRPTATYRRLTEPGAHVFLNPTPWQSNVVLVAQRSVREDDAFAMVTFDADSGILEFDCRTENWKHYLDPDGEMEIDLYRDAGVPHVITTGASYVDKMLWGSSYFGCARYDGRHWRG